MKVSNGKFDTTYLYKMKNGQIGIILENDNSEDGYGIFIKTMGFNNGFTCATYCCDYNNCLDHNSRDGVYDIVGYIEFTNFLGAINEFKANGFDYTDKDWIEVKKPSENTTIMEATKHKHFKHKSQTFWYDSAPAMIEDLNEVFEDTLLVNDEIGKEVWNYKD